MTEYYFEVYFLFKNCFLFNGKKVLVSVQFRLKTKIILDTVWKNLFAKVCSKCFYENLSPVEQLSGRFEFSFKAQFLPLVSRFQYEELFCRNSDESFRGENEVLGKSQLLPTSDVNETRKLAQWFKDF